MGRGTRQPRMTRQIYVMHYKQAPERKASIVRQFRYAIGVEGCAFVESHDAEELTEEFVRLVYSGRDEDWNLRAAALRRFYPEYAFHNRTQKSWSDGVDYDVD